MHAEYDDANLVAVSLALRMKECAVVVTKYAASYQELQRWLRSKSVLEWSRYSVVMTPGSASVVQSGKWEGSADFGYIADLGVLYKTLQSAETARMGWQLPLLGLEAVG